MKRVLLSAVLALGVVTSAEAVPPCWPNSPVNVGSVQYLSPTQLNAWWATNGVPGNVANPHYYVAFHASDQQCKRLYGNGAWAQIIGPSSILTTLNGYTISQGLWFQCKRCPSLTPEVPIEDK